MVIIGKKAGQLGNRLLVFAHFIANSIEYGYEIANPSFYDYADYFDATRDDFFCRYPAQKSSLQNRSLQATYWKLLTGLMPLYRKLGLGAFGLQVLDITVKNYQGENFDMSNPKFVKLAKETPKLLIKDGWLFRDVASIVKHADQVRRHFAPAEEHAARVAELIGTARRERDLLVGVHIRQGDYKKWLNGKFFFETSEYARLMKSFSDSLPGKRVRFLVCSNAAQDERLFAGLDVMLGTNHQLEDMYAFAGCDYLIGPPSTYTMWASFYGSVPLHYVHDTAAPITVADFDARPWA